MMRSLMLKKTLFKCKKKDDPEDMYETADMMVVDTVRDPTEPHQKAVNTLEAEIS